MDKLIRPVFTLDLNYKIEPGLVTIAKYDGTHPCVTAATTAGKVLIHSPHRRNAVTTGRMIWSESNKEIATLNVNDSITALCSGQFLPDNDKDILVIGTSTNVLVYHVHDNKDVFYMDCSDGVKSLALGSFRDMKTTILMVGGNSSVHGYNHKGEEVFWTAVGDVVTSMILMDYNKDGLNELIVSSEDYNIRVFKDKILTELSETEVVTNLTALPENRFAYSVSNGTVGVYEQEVRLWRVKSKNFTISLKCYDLLGQGNMQLITGWSNGKIDCRSIKTGEVFFKDNMNHGLAGVVEGDYRSNGKTDLICISVDGEVKGYTTTKIMPTIPGVTMEQDTIRMLLAQKQSLMMELKHYENNTKYNETVTNQTESFESQGVIPANTRLQIAINTNEGKPNVKPHVEIFIATNNTTIIRAVMIFAEGIFKGETHVVHPPASQLKSEVSVPLYLLKDTPVDIHIKALIGFPNSIQFHVFEVTRQLPRFAMYSLQRNNFPVKPKEFVEFRVNERLQRICMWINQNFLFSSDVEFESGPNLILNLRNLRNNQEIVLIFEISGKVTLHAENLGLAADLVQSLGSFLNLDNLESKANFPSEEENIQNFMKKLQEIQDARLRLGTDVADRLGQIRTLVIRAEDARLNDLKEMPKYYNELMVLNKEIINGNNIRLHNYNEGVESMKKINAIIQQASRLRGNIFVVELESRL
ncbi:unnamed protein product [Brassicogethes aeneus]|uniref:Bardet-Biedl syndrome 2 protein homolog n=1 Tax=Brassicogethes aeneus TaxID=1431903 RepID=A0A9P0AZK8_BRAAE|nr:unnamed protein product [Brassicogethes aeneus]